MGDEVSFNSADVVEDILKLINKRN